MESIAGDLADPLLLLPGHDVLPAARRYPHRQSPARRAVAQPGASRALHRRSSLRPARRRRPDRMGAGQALSRARGRRAPAGPSRRRRVLERRRAHGSSRLPPRSVTYPKAMFGLDRRTIQIAWTLFLFTLLLFVIYKIGRTLIIFAVALIFAHLLSPVVEFVERVIPRRVPRVAALAIVYVVLIGALVAALIPLGSRISSEAAAFANKVPAALEGDPLAHFPIPGWLEPIRPQLTSVLRERMSDLGASLVPMLSRAGTQIITGLGS